MHDPIFVKCASPGTGDPRDRLIPVRHPQRPEATAMRNLLAATSILVLAAAAPAWAQTTPPSGSAPTAPQAGSASGATTQPGSTQPGGTAGTSRTKKHGAHHAMNEESRQASSTERHKDAATNADTQRLNQQELSRLPNQ
ncbi:MAG: hypothetical protein JO010_10150 [Alphaproteobacteria bacterium]|nr:hypothetical protein [Alphaproteobacteria bacterium]